MIREFYLGGELQTNWPACFQFMELQEFMNSVMSLGCITLYGLDEDPDFFKKLETSLELDFRWGINEAAAAPWHHYIVYGVDTKYLPNGTVVTYVHICDQSVRMRINSGFNTYTTKRQSEIIDEVAGSYSIKERVTQETLSLRDWVQSGVQDWRFLEVVSKNAVTKAAQKGDYRLFWVNGNELHYHPPDYGQNPIEQVRIRGGDTGDFLLRASPFKRALSGGEQTTVIYFDPDRLSSITQQANKDTALQQGGVSTGKFTTMAVSDKVALQGAFQGVYRFNPSRNLADIVSESLDTYYAALDKSYEAELVLPDRPQWAPGQLVYVDSTKNGKRAMPEGLWLVEETYRRLNKSENGTLNVRLSRAFAPKDVNKFDTLRVSKNVDVLPSKSGKNTRKVAARKLP